MAALPFAGDSRATLRRVLPKVVFERLWHASIGINLHTHSHVTPGMQDEEAALIAGLVFAAKP